MGVPLAGDYDVLVNRPIDSRMTWTGNFSDLNTIAANGANRYPGLITYITGDQNLYVFQGGTPGTWEKIVTTNVDTITNINSNFTFSNIHNGQVLYVNSSTNVTGFLPSVGLELNSIPSGYNVSVVQLGDGNVVFKGGGELLPDPPGGAGSNATFFRNRINLERTAGKYAVASILRLNQIEFLLYGDLI